MLKHKMGYILMAKPSDHTYLFEQFENQRLESNLAVHEVLEEKYIHRFKFCNDLPLNESNQDVRVNLLEYEQTVVKTGKTNTFSWVTNNFLEESNVYSIMRAGRARWNIENETFKTLKHEGYNLQHNYGHGKKHLSTNLALLMFLAFLIDQVQEFSCPLFNAAKERIKNRKELWILIRSCTKLTIVKNYAQILNVIAHGPMVNCLPDTS